MIIGRDILSALGIQFDFASNSIRWEQATVPMKDSAANFAESFHLEDPEAVQDASSRLKSILDAKYKKADLRNVADSAEHLSQDERDSLHSTLKEYSELFDGTLGKWNMGAYDIELRPDVITHVPFQSLRLTPILSSSK